MSWHRIRKTIHLICFLIFVALPFFDVMRFDIPRQRFYFAGHELWISEFVIIFFTLMFLMFAVVACSVFYGRIYCGYLCPQMIFSEASVALENWIRRWLIKKGLKRDSPIPRGLFYLVLAPASVFLAFVFISYFIEPRDLLHRLIALDMRTAGGIAGVAVTVLTFLDFALVRQRFCVTVCPYGYLQGILGDGNTLLVHYRDEDKQCIECKKCVRVCPMGIDIRKSPHQIECIHCGECIDACDEILAKLNKPGLIHYAWGERGEPLGARAAWYRRLGFRDAKRVVVMLVLLFYASGLFFALSVRRNVLVRIAPDRTTLYREGADGRIYNSFRVSMANRGKSAAAVRISAEGLAGAHLSLDIPLAPGQVLNREFELGVAPAPGAPDVNHFYFVAATQEGTERVPMTFILPAKRGNNR